MKPLHEVPIQSSGGDLGPILHACQVEGTGSGIGAEIAWLDGSQSQSRVPSDPRCARDIESIWKMLLRSIAAGGAGLILVGSPPDLAAACPRYGTSTSIIDSRALITLVQVASPDNPTARVGVVTLDAADQIRGVLAALGLNKSQLAAVLRVSRPTLYGWLNGVEPGNANADRIDQICGLLQKEGISGERPLNARFVRRAISPDSRPLVDLLAEDTIDQDHIAPLLRQAQDLTQATSDRRKRREARLRDLGYEEPSDEEQSKAIGRNVATLDWPK